MKLVKIRILGGLSGEHYCKTGGVFDAVILGNRYYVDIGAGDMLWNLDWEDCEIVDEGNGENESKNESGERFGFYGAKPSKITIEF